MEKLRTVILRPYRTGGGPVFSLTTYDTGGVDRTRICDLYAEALAMEVYSRWGFE